MESDVPEQLEDEMRAVEAQIREAFRGVAREGGVSWSETEVIDNYGTADEARASRAKDAEECWEQLVEDASWHEEPGVGGFNFLDDIGFTYYIAPAMVRCARRGYGEFVGYALNIEGDLKRDRVGLLTPAQSRAIARFVRFMIAVHDALEDDIYGADLKTAYQGWWRQWDDEAAGREGAEGKMPE